MKKVIGKLILCLLIISSSLASASAQSNQLPTENQATPTQSVTVPGGTEVRIELLTPLNSKLNDVGDEVIGELLNSIIIEGKVVLVKGTEVIGHITQVKSAHRLQRQGSMTIVFDRISTFLAEVPIEAVIKSATDFRNEIKLEAKKGKLKGGHSDQRTLDNSVRGVGLAGIAAPPVALGSSAAGGLSGAAIGLGAVMGGGAISGILLTKGNDIRLDPGTVLRIVFVKPTKIPFQDPLNNDQRQQDNTND